MRELISTLNSDCGSEWLITSFDGWNLSLSSGTSVEYAAPRVVFSGVSYMSCPFEFSHPTFRVATASERENIGKLVPLEAEDSVVAIKAETMAGLDPHVFFLVASSATLSPTVKALK